jgi:tetratricopeptide (TPR) repeat protein
LSVFRRWCCVWMGCIGSVALAAPSDALSPLPRRIYLEAVTLEESGEFSSAAMRYEKVFELDPSFTQALIGLGRTQEAAGDSNRAELAYLRAPYDVDAVEALGRLYLGQGRGEDATRCFEKLARLQPSDVLSGLLRVNALALTTPEQVLEEFSRYAAYPAFDLADSELTLLILDIVDTLEQEGELAIAEDLLAVVPLTEVDDPLLTARAETVTLRRRAREWALLGTQPLDPFQRERLTAGRAALRANDLPRARGLIDALLAERRRNPEVQLLLSEVDEHAGEIESAERAAWVATQLAPTEARFLIRYGDLLARYHGGRFDGQAAEALEKALTLQPTSDEILIRLARVQARSGEIEQAIANYRSYLLQAPPSAERDEVGALLRDFERALPRFTPLEAQGEPPPGVSESAWLALHMAYVYHQPTRDGGEQDPEQRGQDLRAALTALKQAMGEAPQLVEPYNLSGAIYLELGDIEKAAEVYYSSLEREPNQPSLLVALAELEQRRGDSEAALALIERAAAQGASDALYLLARRLFDEWDLWRSRTVLQQYFAAPASSLTRPDALALERELNRLLLLGAASGVGAIALVVGLALRRQRRRGRRTTILGLVGAEPRLHREVLRLVAAVRHEVIKHNTTGLETLADSIESGEAQIDPFILERLYGDSGALEQFDRYLGELQALGERAGVWLDLSDGRSPFSSLIVAMSELRGLRASLEGAPGFSVGNRLYALSDTINLEAYSALGELLKTLSTCEIERAMFDLVIQEAYSTEGGVVARPDIPIMSFESGLFIRALREDIQLILVNLCRNALRLVEPDCVEPVGLRLVVEVDPITGVETVAFRVCDRVSQPLTTEMIRSGYIERGLGLAVDAVERNHGSIAVEDEPGWLKAVVVRFPRVE